MAYENLGGDINEKAPTPPVAAPEWLGHVCGVREGITVPNGGETVEPGSKLNIIWGTEGYDPEYKMDLYYSNNGGETFQPIAESIANSGSYLWTAPQGEETVKALVKITDHLDTGVSGISADYFAVGKGTPAEKAKEAEAVAAAKAKEAEALADKAKEAARTGSKKLYDLLIKRVDPKDTKKQKPTAYEDGDIVTIKPAGHAWGGEETSRFLIVQAYLTDKEVQDLTKIQEKTTGVFERGEQVKKMVKMRKYKINLKKKELSDKGAPNKRGHLEGVTLSDLSAVVDKDVESK